MDSHLKGVPGLGTFTARGLKRSELVLYSIEVQEKPKATGAILELREIFEDIIISQLLQSSNDSQFPSSLARVNIDYGNKHTLRVVTLRVLVGRRTGPLTRSSLVLARSMSSWQTFSRESTFRLVRVILILWVFCNCDLINLWLIWQQMWGIVLGPPRTLSLAFGKTFLFR